VLGVGRAGQERGQALRRVRAVDVGAKDHAVAHPRGDVLFDEDRRIGTGRRWSRPGGVLTGGEPQRRHHGDGRDCSRLARRHQHLMLM